MTTPDYPPDSYVMVEPAAGRRVWFGTNSDHTEVSEEYVEEKTGARGADLRNLTILLAAAFGVPPVFK